MPKRFFIILFFLVSLFFLLLFLNRQVILSHLMMIQRTLSNHFVSDQANVFDLRVDFLDIGQGDATLIEFSNQEQMLVDCALDSRVLEALGRVMSPLDRTIDYLVLTHPHKDHYGGCVDVLRRFEVKHIILSGYHDQHSSYYQEFSRAVDSEGASIQNLETEEKLNIGSSTLHFLYPDHSLVQSSGVPGDDREVGTNNTSVVFLLTTGEIDLLMTGDAEAELEQYLVEKYGSRLDVEILKAGHHGSPTSSLDEFLALVTPLHTVISAGVDNEYGHPSLRVLNRLKRINSAVWRTDTQGDILIRVEDQKIYVETSRKN